MTNLNTTADAANCPQCGRLNRCAIAAGAEPASCWCMSKPINRTLAKAYAGQQRCLCAQCGSALEIPTKESSTKSEAKK